MTYVDGFVVPVPEKNIEAYRKISEAAGRIWLEYGALQYVECVADDVPEGEQTDFYRAVQRREGETVVFSWIVYKSREHRDRVMEKIMADPRIPNEMPFDLMRMLRGGFRPIVDM